MIKATTCYRQKAEEKGLTGGAKTTSEKLIAIVFTRFSPYLFACDKLLLP